MLIQEMHYDFKQKLNRLDSKQYEDLLIPQIDWKLNEGLELFIKIVGNPRENKPVGFDIGQRTIDEIRTVIKDQKTVDGIIPEIYDEAAGVYSAALPTDCWYYLDSKVFVSREDFHTKMRRVIVTQHGDESDTSIFYKSSFNWREINIRFNDAGMLLYTDNTFTVDKVCYQYCIKPPYMHNAADYLDGTYEALDGTALTGRRHCILPEPAHRTIVDLAVFLTASDNGLPDLAVKKAKLNLDN